MCAGHGRGFYLYRSSPVRGRVVLDDVVRLAPYLALYLDVYYPCLCDTAAGPDVRPHAVGGAQRAGYGGLGLAPVERGVRMSMTMDNGKTKRKKDREFEG